MVMVGVGVLPWVQVDLVVRRELFVIVVIVGVGVLPWMQVDLVVI